MEIDIENYFSLNDVLTIDMRTKEEYKSSHILNAINFEILNHEERKEVSILYNEKKIEEAYLKAYEYSILKLPKLFKIIKKNKNKKIVFYCSRGGSRSTIVYEVFRNLKGIEIYKINGGYKSFRRYVNEYFEKSLNKFDFRVIHGYYGSSIDELLNHLTELELANFNFNEIINNDISQKQLDNILFDKLFNLKDNVIYIGNENRQFSNACIRKEFLDKLKNSKHILLKDSIDLRIENIYNRDFVNISEKFLSNLIIKIKEMKKIIGNKLVSEIIGDLLNENYKIAIKELVINYYDNIYKKEILEYESYYKIYEFNNVNELFKNWSVK
ncbi:rhodanese-like domain-containing protein [Clostridiaceae bacterium HSG29]|nr:rhodanese-like domain-containing protein [Clostridiaceae bacterium HSG29]